jgi:hypothetical protein
MIVRTAMRRTLSPSLPSPRGCSSTRLTGRPLLLPQARSLHQGSGAFSRLLARPTMRLALSRPASTATKPQSPSSTGGGKGRAGGEKGGLGGSAWIPLAVAAAAVVGYLGISQRKSNAKRPLVVIWDYDLSLIDVNSDTYVPERLLPSLTRFIEENKRSLGWTELMAEVARRMHAA